MAPFRSSNSPILRPTTPLSDWPTLRCSCLPLSAVLQMGCLIRTTALRPVTLPRLSAVRPAAVAMFPLGTGLSMLSRFQKRTMKSNKTCCISKRLQRPPLHAASNRKRSRPTPTPSPPALSRSPRNVSPTNPRSPSANLISAAASSLPRVCTTSARTERNGSATSATSLTTPPGRKPFLPNPHLACVPATSLNTTGTSSAR